MNAVISYRNPAPISPSADRVAVRNQSHRIRRSAVTVCLFTFSSVSFIIPSLTCSASGNLGPPAHLIIIKVCLVCLLFGLRCRPCGQRLSSIAKRIQMFRKAATDGEIRCGRCCCCSRFFSLSLFFLLGLFLFFFTFWLRPFGTLSALFIVAFDWIVFETVNGRRRRRLLARPSFFTRRNIEPFTVLLAFTGWLFYFLFFFSCSSTDFSPPWRVVYRVSTGFYWIFFEGGGFALLCFDFDSNWRRFFFSQSRPRIKHSAGGRSANKIGSSIKKSDPGRHRRAEDVQKKNENQKQKPKKKNIPPSAHNLRQQHQQQQQQQQQPPRSALWRRFHRKRVCCRNCPSFLLFFSLIEFKDQNKKQKKRHHHRRGPRPTITNKTQPERKKKQKKTHTHTHTVTHRRPKRHRRRSSSTRWHQR